MAETKHPVYVSAATMFGVLVFWRTFVWDRFTIKRIRMGLCLIGAGRFIGSVDGRLFCLLP